MKKWIRDIIGIVIIGLLVWYLIENKHQLESLKNLGPMDLFWLYILAFLGTANNSRLNQQIIKGLNIHVPFGDMFLIQNTGRLLNYLPMKAGTVFRGNYLKRKYNLAYARYGTFLMYSSLVLTFVGGLLGLVFLIYEYGVQKYDNMVLAGVFLSTAIFSLVLLAAPLPIPSGQGRLMSAMRNFLNGRKDVLRNRRVIFHCLLHTVLILIIQSLRFYIIFRTLEIPVTPGGLFILGTLGFATFVISFTPGALGIREVVLTAGSTVLGIPLEMGALAAMLDRGIMLSWTFVCGGGCTFWLWRKYPLDFANLSRKKSNEDKQKETA